MNSNDARSFAQSQTRLDWYPGDRPLPPHMTETRPVARFLKKHGLGLGILSLLTCTGVGLGVSAASFFALTPIFGYSAVTPLISMIPFYAGVAAGFASAIKLGSYSDASPLQKTCIGAARREFVTAIGADVLRRLDSDDDCFEKVGPPSWKRRMRVEIQSRLTEQGLHPDDAIGVVEDYSLTPAEVLRYDQMLHDLPDTEDNRLTLRMIASYRAMEISLKGLKPVSRPEPQSTPALNPA
ncbi:MAG: hypothetical protein Alpg2KO_16480 [Alphaproteobacteria bacterium]